MGTNYYARIIPKEADREELKRAIDNNDFSTIQEKAGKMYSRFSMDFGGNSSGGEVHLGKASHGWKFLWNSNVYIKRNFHKVEEDDGNGRIISRFIDDPSTLIYLYPLTKEGLKAFIDRQDVFIVDEYDEVQDKEEFWDMAINWSKDREGGGLDSASYEELERKRGSRYKPFPATGDLVEALQQEGYKFTSPSRFDFYSDGLRFSTCTDFS